MVCRISSRPISTKIGLIALRDELVLDCPNATRSRTLSEISCPCSQWRPGSMLQLRGGMRSKNAGQLPPRLSFHAAPSLRLARIATCVQGSLLDCDGIAQRLHARSCTTWR